MALAQNLNKNPVQNVVIKVWGERLGSPYNERRKLYIEVVASNPPTWVRGVVDLLDYAVYNVSSLLSLYAPRFPNPMPWWLFSRCERCHRQFLNSIAKNLPTNTWRTQYCLRHGILHNYALFSIDNKERSVAINGDVIKFTSATNKYSVEFTVYRDRAMATVNNDSNQWRFTYNNHTNSYPLSSSYAFLVGRVLGFVNSLRDVVRICGVRNIYVNGVQVCPPPASDSTDASAASGGEGGVDGGGEVGGGCGVGGGEAGGV
jgi:hypothetical protein